MFDLFDKLCLLSDGNVVYFGDADKCVDMFAGAGLQVPSMRNPADHFLMTINRDFESVSHDPPTNACRGRVHTCSRRLVPARMSEFVGPFCCSSVQSCWAGPSNT